MSRTILMHPIYKQDKSRYEKQQNVFKSSKEMIDLYHDLLERHPALMMIIDALHKVIHIFKVVQNTVA